MIKWIAGKKREESEKLNKSYILYDNCNVCPLRVYVDLVCNGNIDSLIVSGHPPKDILDATRLALIIEFSELSGNMHTSTVNMTLKKILLLKMNILLLEVCMRLIVMDSYNESIAYLKTIGISLDIPDNESDKSKILRKLDGICKGKIVNLNKELKRYDELNNISDGDRPTFSLYNDQLSVLSSHFKFNIDMNISLAQYASYLKLFNNTISHGKKHRIGI